MKKKITKSRFSISVEPETYKRLDHVTNKSKYIEWLIYQDLLKANVDGIKDMMI